MSDQANIEIITDECGNTIGQRRYNQDDSQDIRILDHHGEYTDWQSNVRVIPEKEKEILEKMEELPIEVGEDLDPVALLDEGRIDEKTYDKMMTYIESLNVIKNSDMLPEQRFPEDIPYTNEIEPPLDAYMHKPGAKDDENKLRAGLVLGGFSRSLGEVCRVGTYGAKKYSDGGWMHVPDGKKRYMDAAMRHWLEHMAGATFNMKDGNVRHLAQVIWNLCCVLEFEIIEEQINQVEAEYGEPE